MGLFSSIGNVASGLVNTVGGVIGLGGNGGGILGTLGGQATQVGPQYNVNGSAYEMSPEQRRFLEQLQAEYSGGVQTPTDKSFQDMTAANQMATQQALDASSRSAASQMASTRGVQNPVLLAKQIQEQQAQAGQQAGADLSEQNLRAMSQAGQAKAQERQNVLGQIGTSLGNIQEGNAAAEKQRQAAFEKPMELQANANTEAKKSQASMLGGLGSALVTKSDINYKTNIAPAGQDVKQIMDSLNPYSFDYKRKSDGGNDQVGVMAQDLEQTPYGQKMVMNTKEGKMIKPNAGTMLAMDSVNNHRLNRVEDFLDKLANGESRNPAGVTMGGPGMPMEVRYHPPEGNQEATGEMARPMQTSSAPQEPQYRAPLRPAPLTVYGQRDRFPVQKEADYDPRAMDSFDSEKIKPRKNIPTDEKEMDKFLEALDSKDKWKR